MWQSRLGQRQRDELAVLSRTDPLTGCLNRRGFSERLDAELAERIGATAGVACHPGGGGDELHRHADADLYRRKVTSRTG